MRVVFSIILNGIHHLKHNNRYQNILDNCDYWVVVEGASLSQGSTSWCNTMKEEYHENGHSVDGTVEFLEELSKENKKLIYVPSSGFWNSKDEQVNAAIQQIKNITDNCFLWQMDIDEEWTEESLNQAETELKESGAKAGGFLANCFLGKDILAKGEWGELKPSGYFRLWDWKGESFIRHEPPIINYNNGEYETKLLTPRFNHYNYYFEKDVKFKNDWYSGHEGILERWKMLNSLPKETFPIHISSLIQGSWGQTYTFIFKT